MRVLVCGGRDYQNYAKIKEELDKIEISYLISGGAKGADTSAELYALEKNISIRVYMAQWARDGKSAGYIRNQEMLEKGKPDLVIAFPGGKGTANMVKIAKEAGIEVREIE